MKPRILFGWESTGFSTGSQNSSLTKPPNNLSASSSYVTTERTVHVANTALLCIYYNHCRHGVLQCCKWSTVLNSTHRFPWLLRLCTPQTRLGRIQIETFCVQRPPLLLSEKKQTASQFESPLTAEKYKFDVICSHRHRNLQCFICSIPWRFQLLRFPLTFRRPILIWSNFGNPMWLNKYQQEVIRRWDSERELLRSAPGSYPNSLK